MTMFNLLTPRIVTPNHRTHISSRFTTKKNYKSLPLLRSLKTPSRFELQPSKTTTLREKSLAPPLLVAAASKEKEREDFASWLMKKKEMRS